MTVPKEILAQHIAVLGKTGSGKTSTAKLAIEQVVADGARVCVLDPIKSDWWGLTSSVSGKRAGLPFHILGGPHGHVPLHSAAGKAIADVVATGALPLSIIDMADFEPGGQAKFFVDFAPTLLRKMRGVVYLVIEEAHLFAPKERSGIGAENLSIHWAKTMATAGRSKGVRLVLVTQRTQALHNALLGSCDTLIAHRLTAPADQEPVVKWLKANTSKEILEQVATSLASLKTGEGWICSGEAKVFKRVSFPRIATYDNTATPTGDGETREIKTAPVDPEKLRAIIGDAVEKAKADDPRELRTQLASVRSELAKAQQVTHSNQQASPLSTKRVEILTDADRALLEKVNATVAEAAALMHEDLVLAGQRFKASMDRACDEYGGNIALGITKANQLLTGATDKVRFEKILGKLATLPALPSHTTPTTTQRVARQVPGSSQTGRVAPAPATSRPARLVSDGSYVPGKGGDGRMLAALAQIPSGMTDSKLAILSGMTKRGGAFRTYLSKLRVAGFVEGDRRSLRITGAGQDVAGDVEPLPSGAALLDYWRGELGDSGARKIFDALVESYPHALSKAETATAAAMNVGGGAFRTYVSKLRVMGLIEGSSELRASEELFSS